ncbi:unnamed protein product [Caretta caretta]
MPHPSGNPGLSGRARAGTRAGPRTHRQGALFSQARFAPFSEGRPRPIGGAAARVPGTARRAAGKDLGAARQSPAAATGFRRVVSVYSGGIILSSLNRQHMHCPPSWNWER